MRIELKFAIFYLLASFIWSCIEYITGLESTYINLHPYFVTPFYIILTCVIYLLAIREKRKKLKGEITFRKAFVTGTILSLFILLLNPIPFYIFNTFINPNFFKDFAQYNINSQELTEEAANAYYNFNNLLIRGSLYRLIMGIIASLIIAVFIKKTAIKK